MKKSHFLAALAILSLLTGTTAALARDGSDSDSSGKGSASVRVNLFGESNDDSGRDHPEDDNTNHDMNDDHGGERNASVRAMMDARLKSSMDHWKTWAFNGGIMGTVTDTDDDEITVKASNGTVYTVDTSDANIRTSNGGSIETGDHVYIQGATNDTHIVATLIIDGKGGAATPTNDDKRMAIAGTVTARNSNTLTVIGKNGTTYTVAAANATIWKGDDKSSSISDIDEGDAVVVQGTVSGSSVTATKIYAVTFPEASANGGIRGTVTAVDDDSLTLMVAGGATYTVDTNDADFKDRKGSDESMDDVHVGDMIVVNGDVDGSSIDADVVSEAKVQQGFFARIGLFFKGIFGKKGHQ